MKWLANIFRRSPNDNASVNDRDNMAVSPRPLVKKEIYFRDQVPILEEMYQKKGPSQIGSYVKESEMYLNKIAKGDKETMVTLDRPFIDSTAAGKNRKKEHRIGSNLFLVKNVFKDATESIYHNVYPSQFLDEMEDGELRYFTYVIDEDGLHLGDFKNTFEFGTGHGYLLRKDIPREDELNMLAAGELVLQTDPEKPVIKNVDESEIHLVKEPENLKPTSSLTFNFQSGSYMATAGIEKFPEYKDFLINVVSDVLSYSTSRKNKNRMNVYYTENVIFPDIIPTFSEIQRHIDKEEDITYYPNRRDISKGNVVYFVLEKDGQKTMFPFTKEALTLKEAQEYFSSHPYKPVVIFDPERKSYFYNPVPENPSYFVNIETSDPRYPEMLVGRKKKKTKKSVKKPKKKQSKKKSVKNKKSIKNKKSKKSLTKT